MTPEEFQAALAKQGITLSARQMQQFQAYFRLLVDYNQRVNLTTITAEPDVYLKHFYDSVTPAFYVPGILNATTLVDVGAGAGFPSLPLKILNPELQVTIVDSLNKRIVFLQQLVDQLGLSNVRLVHARAEEFGGRRSPDREQFDYATARALARLSVMSELCLPLVKVGGALIALKGAQAEAELTTATKAIHVLGGQVTKDEALTLLPHDEERHIIVIKKVKKTPIKYPRKAGTPNKEPIQ
ncbi:16S rRNA (guanine(527)-N(7))-methyltransferase RsmG [Fructilactobacillus carniphilus]|uniref:Ribosomal RNA small subunit methyltransferase G n=1 Tax=Fructilactobacillus carniphilus TaxID=2940297 RepID=A0ABY5BWI7_9LACO|nr:16S rRNA (guanine(527)-N(7))-methyltransferase RsmG [Fructilactobacillus carniphilus]USS90195.1 16S rRNA (guanine(527)-N(7))-methyltransferase RsmG [Fructilactobacillus carniphilus]